MTENNIKGEKRRKTLVTHSYHAHVKKMVYKQTVGLMKQKTKKKKDMIFQLQKQQLPRTRAPIHLLHVWFTV